MPESWLPPTPSTSQKGPDLTLSSDSKSEGPSISSPHPQLFTEQVGTPGSRRSQHTVRPELSWKRKHQTHISLRGFASQSLSCLQTVQPGSREQLFALASARCQGTVYGSLSGVEPSLVDIFPHTTSVLSLQCLPGRLPAPFLSRRASSRPALRVCCPGADWVPLFCARLPLRTGNGPPDPLPCSVFIPRNFCTI